MLIETNYSAIEKKLNDEQKSKCTPKRAEMDVKSFMKWFSSDIMSKDPKLYGEYKEMYNEHLNNKK